MKKLSLNPLQLDKQTIAILNRNQLQQLIGGFPNHISSEPTTNGTSNGCGIATSICNIIPPDFK